MKLEGKIAVGIVIVSGSQNKYRISDTERLKIVQEVMEGADFLVNAEPRAKIQFVYDIQVETVSTQPPADRTIIDHWKKWPSGFTDIDAALFYTNGKAYFFKGNQYIRYTPGSGVNSGYPKPIAGNWKKWPSGFTDIDGAFVYHNDKAYFFKGNQYIRYTPGSGVDSGYPKPIAGNWKKWPSGFTDIDAALFYNNGKAYFFKGNQYIRYTPGSGVDSGYPKLIAGNWKNWPSGFADIDAALFYNNGKAYFFKSNQYIRYSPGKGVDPYCSSYDACEAPWRDAALLKLGYPIGSTGLTNYVNDLRTNYKASAAYVAFFTKYPLNHFAYASGAKVVMSYENDGWGPDNINRVFAHETCHVFGAADEYKDSGCDCYSTHGNLGIQNGNCVNCPGTQVSCLMRKNTLSICGYTRGQVGWDYGLNKIGAALFYTNEKAYFFDGSEYVRYSPGSGVDSDYPKPIAGNWKKWPSGFTDIDGAFVYHNDKAYFFKGDQYIRYTPGSGVDAGYPKPIAGNWKKWPSGFTDIDAALFYTNGKAYFFKGNQYIRYTPGSGVNSGYPKPIAGNWKKWPSGFTDIDGAFVYHNDKAYFFKGDQYIRYTPGKGVDSGYPKSIKHNWLSVLKW